MLVKYYLRLDFENLRLMIISEMMRCDDDRDLNEDLWNFKLHYNQRQKLSEEKVLQLL
jgi:hypothetical protein